MTLIISPFREWPHCPKATKFCYYWQHSFFSHREICTPYVLLSQINRASSSKPIKPSSQRICTITLFVVSGLPYVHGLRGVLNKVPKGPFSRRCCPWSCHEQILGSLAGLASREGSKTLKL